MSCGRTIPGGKICQRSSAFHGGPLSETSKVIFRTIIVWLYFPWICVGSGLYRKPIHWIPPHWRTLRRRPLQGRPLHWRPLYWRTFQGATLPILWLYIHSGPVSVLKHTPCEHGWAITLALQAQRRSQPYAVVVQRQNIGGIVFRDCLWRKSSPFEILRNH